MAEARLPVLLTPTVKSCALSPHAGAEDAARITARVKRAWGRFKLAAMSSFAFVEATGPIYAGKLLRDALGLGPSHLPQDPAPQLSPGLDAAQKLASAEMVLRAMSMTEVSPVLSCWPGMARMSPTTPTPAPCIVGPAAAIRAR